jgi:hypothetical protein
LNLSNLNHGIYILKVYATGKLSSSDTETIESNILQHKLVYYESSVGTPLLAIQVPEVTEQYTNIPISYLFVSSEDDNDDYTLEFIIDNKEEDKLTIKANTLAEHNLYFENSGIYSLTV